MKRSLWVTFGFALLIMASLAFTNDEPLYKNLKVLPKNTTKEQMDSIMKHFTASLNVKCNFCHVRNEEAKTWDYASDKNKHKLISRDMMKMTTKINKKYFDVGGGKNSSTALMVTCYTCHNGHKEPEAMPPAPQPKPATDTTKR